VAGGDDDVKCTQCARANSHGNICGTHRDSLVNDDARAEHRARFNPHLAAQLDAVGEDATVNRAAITNDDVVPDVAVADSHPCSDLALLADRAVDKRRCWRSLATHVASVPHEHVFFEHATPREAHLHRQKTCVRYARVTSHVDKKQVSLLVLVPRHVCNSLVFCCK
jgi:hypothetical protein